SSAEARPPKGLRTAKKAASAASIRHSTHGSHHRPKGCAAGRLAGSCNERTRSLNDDSRGGSELECADWGVDGFTMHLSIPDSTLVGPWGLFSDLTEFKPKWETRIGGIGSRCLDKMVTNRHDKSYSPGHQPRAIHDSFGTLPRLRCAGGSPA